MKTENKNPKYIPVILLPNQSNACFSCWFHMVNWLKYTWFCHAFPFFVFGHLAMNLQKYESITGEKITQLNKIPKNQKTKIWDEWNIYFLNWKQKSQIVILLPKQCMRFLLVFTWWFGWNTRDFAVLSRSHVEPSFVSLSPVANFTKEMPNNIFS